MLQISPKTSWPTGDVKPIAILPSHPRALSLRHRLVFESRIDDLGVYQVAAIELADGQEARLVKYADDEEPGTLVFVDSAADVPATLALIARALGTRTNDLLWTPDSVQLDFVSA